MSNTPLVVVLDLDETLIYTSKELVNIDHYAFDYEDEITHVRAGAVEFVQRLLNNPLFKVMIWTASGKEYAHHVVKGLGFSVDQFERVWHNKLLNKRELELNDPYWGQAQYRNEKDLLKVRRSLKVSLSRIVAVDDVARYYKKQYSNQVIVPQYTGQEDDIFPRVYDFLVYLQRQENIRPVEKRGWINKNWNQN